MCAYALWSFDVTQVYLQCAAMLTRPVFVRPPGEIADPNSRLLTPRKAIFGPSDSGDYWYDTVAKVLTTYVRLRVATGDPVLYYQRAFCGLAR